MITIETVAMPHPHVRRPRTGRHGPVIKGNSSTIAGRIGLARVAKGFTQKQLAGKIGKSRATAIQYEQGKLTPPIKVFETLADVLEVSPEWLAFGRQAVNGLDSAVADVTMIPEINGDHEVLGALGLPSALITDLRAGPDTKVLKITKPAPAFGFGAGDRLFINITRQFGERQALYVVSTRNGAEIVRLLPRLSILADPIGFIDLVDTSGATRAYHPEDIEVIGEVIGSIRLDG